MPSELEAQVKDALEDLLADPTRADAIAVAELGDLIYETTMTRDLATRVAAALVELTLVASNPDMQEELLNTLANLVGWNRVPFDVVEPILRVRDVLDEQPLAHLMDVLGLLQDERAHELLRDFEGHPSLEVREAARMNLSAYDP